MPIYGWMPGIQDEDDDREKVPADMDKVWALFEEHQLEPKYKPIGSAIRRAMYGSSPAIKELIPHLDPAMVGNAEFEQKVVDFFEMRYQAQPMSPDVEAMTMDEIRAGLGL